MKSDQLASFYMVRCEEFLKNPPSPDWNGTYKLSFKWFKLHLAKVRLGVVCIKILSSKLTFLLQKAIKYIYGNKLLEWTILKTNQL